VNIGASGNPNEWYFRGFGIRVNALSVRQMPLMCSNRVTLLSFTALKKLREEEEIAI